MTGPDVLFADQRFVVLNKPAGLPVHAGPRGGPSVEDWFPALSRRKEGPWLAHRLDADTSGCLVVALRKAALIEAQAAFGAGRVEKVYWAVVRGRPAGLAGVVEQAVAKRNDAAGWRMVADDAGSGAVTAWRVLGEAAGVSWLELRPRTGRTHQVRVHCALLGCPVLGDGVYGGSGGEGGGPLQLLARAVRMPVEPVLAATAPVPAHMRETIGACGGGGLCRERTG